LFFGLPKALPAIEEWNYLGRRFALRFHGPDRRWKIQPNLRNTRIAEGVKPIRS
jgi:hypothetical protein